MTDISKTILIPSSLKAGTKIGELNKNRSKQTEIKLSFFINIQLKKSTIPSVNDTIGSEKTCTQSNKQI
jgi:hypothetical protein